jgi:hypothetical protein
MSTLEELTAKGAELRAEYARVGAPILNAIVETSKQITDLKRERGELFYVEYMRYGSEYTEECDDLEDAKGYAEALEDNGDGSVTRIYGPSVELTKEFGGDW